MLFGTSIGENIRYGQEGVTQAEIEAAAREANAHAFISKLPMVIFHDISVDIILSATIIHSLLSDWQE